MYISNNLDKIIENWVNNKIQNYKKFSNRIFVGQSIIDVNPLWIFEYKNKIFLSVQNNTIIDDDIYNWQATILGPEGSPYVGGIFYLRNQLYLY